MRVTSSHMKRSHGYNLWYISSNYQVVASPQIDGPRALLPYNKMPTNDSESGVERAKNRLKREQSKGAWNTDNYARAYATRYSFMTPLFNCTDDKRKESTSLRIGGAESLV